MNEEFVVLRLLHIVSGSFWVGATVFLAFILEPTLTEMGPSVKGPVMAKLGKKIAIAIGSAAVITIIAGLVLAMRLESEGRVEFDSSWGVAILIGLIVAVIALVTGAMTGVTAGKMARAAAQAQGGDGPPPPEVMGQLQALGAKMKILGRSTAVLTVVGVGTMAAARFV